MAEEVVVARTVSKSKKIYNNSKWDLVDAKKETNFDYNKIDKSKLSKDLQNKNTEELKVHVEKLSKERSKIQKEIQKIDAKRRKYIAANAKNNTSDELESVMIKAIKRQAKSKNYSW